MVTFCANSHANLKTELSSCILRICEQPRRSLPSIGDNIRTRIEVSVIDNTTKKYNMAHLSFGHKLVVEMACEDQPWARKNCRQIEPASRTRHPYSKTLNMQRVCHILSSDGAFSIYRHSFDFVSILLLRRRFFGLSSISRLMQEQFRDQSEHESGTRTTRTGIIVHGGHSIRAPVRLLRGRRRL